MVILRILIFFLIVGMVGSHAVGEIVLKPLKQIVKESDLIALGTISKIEVTDHRHPENGFESKVTVAVEEVLKGDHEREDLELYYFPALLTDTEFIKKERCMFFMKSEQGKYRMTEGYGGKVLIEGDRAKPLYMKDEEWIQGFDSFYKKTKRLIRRGVRGNQKNNSVQRIVD